MVEELLKQLLQLFGRSRYNDYTIVAQQYKPMLRLLAELRQRGIDTKELDALEIFGRDGLDHTTTYAKEVKSLEVWEINPKWRFDLAKNLPEASIRIVDSYAELIASRNKFDLIVVDNAIGNHGSRIDHFDLFPDLIFNATKDESLLVLNILPYITKKTLRHFPDLLEPGYLEKRRQFYHTDDPMNIDPARIIDAYGNFVERNDYRLLWSFRLKRSGAGIDYLVLKIKK